MSNSSENRHILFLFTVLGIFLVAYFAHPALPGNNADYPLGWWGWFDQGEYLKSAKAIASKNFESANYYYPPLYPILGSLFAVGVPMHAFTLVNIACFLIFAHCFVTTGKRYVGWGWAVTIFVATLLFSKHSVQVWTEPWTSSLVSAIIAFLIMEIDQGNRSNFQISRVRLALWGSLGGAVFLARPADAVVMSPLFIYAAWRLWHQTPHKDTVQVPIRGSIKSTLAMVVPGIVGIGLFVGFNVFVHGSAGGRYFAMAETNGFHAGDLLEKTVSLVLDAGTLYNVPSESIFSKAKWLALFVPASIYCVMRGTATTRLILVVITIQLLIYFPYADLLPTGVWHYHNIHYFKWMFPFTGLLILLWLKGFPFPQRRLQRGRVWWASLLIGSLLLSVQFRLDDISPDDLQVVIVQDATGAFLRISSGTHRTIDKISLPQLSGDFHAVYFSTTAKVIAEGRELKFVRDYRFLPSNEGVDLLFIRPVNTSSIEIYAGDMKFNETSASPQWLAYKFTVGIPTWMR